MYRFIWHIGGDLYYFAWLESLNWMTYIYQAIEPTNYEALTAEEIGQIMGGN